MSYDAGSITATLDVDRTPFQQGLDLAKQQADEFDGKTFTANLGIDSAAGEAELRRFREQLEQLNTNGSGPRIELDTMSATAKLRELIEQLDRLDRYTSNPRVDIDISGASAQLIELLEQLDRLDRFRATPRIDLDGYALARAQIASLQHQLDQLARSNPRPGVGGINQLGSSAQRSGGHMRGLIAAAIALSPALIPIGAAATGGIVALGGAFTAAAAGAGLFFGAMKTNLGPVKDAIKNFDKQGLDALKNLDEGQKKVALGAIELKNQWKAAADSVRPQTYAVATNVLGGLSNALTLLKPVLVAASDAFVELSAGFERATKGATFKGFTEFLTRQTGPAIKTFGKALGDLGATFAHVFEAFEPLIKPAEDAFLRFTGNIRRWSEGLATNSGFQKFLQYIRDNGPRVARTLGDIVSAVGGLLAALAPVGGPLLDFIDNVVRFIKGIADNPGFRDFTRSVGDLITKINELFQKLSPATIAGIGGAFGSVAGFINQIFIPAVQAAINIVDKLLGKSSELKESGPGGGMKTNQRSGFGNWLLDAFKGSAQNTTDIFRLARVQIDSVVRYLGSFYGDMLGVGKFLLSGLAKGISEGFSFITDIPVRIFAAIVGGIKKLFGIQSPSTVMARIGHDIVQGLINGIKSLAGAVTGALAGILGAIGRFAGSAVSAIGRFASSALSTLGRWAGSAVSAVGRFASSALSTLGRWAGSAVSAVARFASGALSTLGRWAGSAVSAVGRFASSALTTLGRFASQGVSAIGRFTSSATSAIANGFSRMVSSAQSGASRILSVVGSLPGRIRGALGNLGGLLYGAGQAIMNGLGNGIKSAAQGVFNFVSSIAGKIASLKGPLPYDRQLLVPHGTAIMAGLDQGLQTRFGGVLGNVKSMAGQIGDAVGRSAFAGAGIAGGSVSRGGTTYNYTLNGVGPDVSGLLAEQQRQRDFWSGG